MYAITPEVSAVWTQSAVLECVHAALEAGVKLVQLRQKNWPWEALLPFAQQVGTLCEQHGALLVLNDAPVVQCLQSLDALPGFAGVHLGRDDMPIDQARALMGANFLIGASCYDQLKLAQAAKRNGADYLAFGAVYPSPTKPGAARADLSLFEQAQALDLPLVAIGGISLHNLKALALAGTQAVAGVSALFETKNGRPDAALVKRNARDWIEEFECWRIRK